MEANVKTETTYSNLTDLDISVGDKVQFEKDGKTLVGEVVAIDPHSRGQYNNIVVETGAGSENRYHAKASQLRKVAGAEG